MIVLDTEKRGPVGLNPDYIVVVSLHQVTMADGKVYPLRPPQRSSDVLTQLQKPENTYVPAAPGYFMLTKTGDVRYPELGWQMSASNLMPIWQCPEDPDCEACVGPDGTVINAWGQRFASVEAWKAAG